MKKVMCIGQAAYDITLPLEDYPLENTKVRANGSVECGGGSASNACYLLAKWGMDSHFAGVVGNDLYGDRIKDEFAKIGVHTEYLKTIEDFKTSTAYIIANKTNGSRTIIVNGHKGTFLTEDCDIKVDAIMLDGREVEFCKKVIQNNPGAITVLDAGNIKPEIIELGKLVKYFVCSHDFAQEYTGMTATSEETDNLIRIHQKLEEDFKNNVIITLEASGSFTKYNDKYIIVPSIEVKPLDSTGAGDIYHGALTYFLMNDYNLVDAMRLSNITGAISTTRIGGRYSVPSLNEVIHYGEIDVI